MEKQPLLNTYVNNVTMTETVQIIEQMIVDRIASYIVAVNVDVIMKIEQDNYLKKITDHADMVLVDGKPLIWISKLYKTPVREKVSGSDLVPVLCENAAIKGYKLYILGGLEGVAQKAKRNLERRYPDIKIVGIYAPPLGFEKDTAEINKINTMISEAEPDILITCFGCPKQEKFVFENHHKYSATVSICAGATVDFLAGNVKRAPSWMSNHGLEWLFRFLQEPKRLFKRYFIDDIKIVGLVWKYRKKVI